MKRFIVLIISLVALVFLVFGGEESEESEQPAEDISDDEVVADESVSLKEGDGFVLNMDDIIIELYGADAIRFTGEDIEDELVIDLSYYMANQGSDEMSLYLDQAELTLNTGEVLTPPNNSHSLDSFMSGGDSSEGIVQYRTTETSLEELEWAELTIPEARVNQKFTAAEERTWTIEFE